MRGSGSETPPTREKARMGPRKTLETGPLLGPLRMLHFVRVRPARLPARLKALKRFQKKLATFACEGVVVVVLGGLP